MSSNLPQQTFENSNLFPPLNSDLRQRRFAQQIEGVARSRAESREQRTSAATFVASRAADKYLHMHAE